MLELYSIQYFTQLYKLQTESTVTKATLEIALSISLFVSNTLSSIDSNHQLTLIIKRL